MNDSPFVSLVIPAYNEGKRLKDSLITIQKYIIEKPYSVEIIIVDDGSQDETVAVANSYLNGKFAHSILSSSKNRGKGYAVKKGMLTAKGKYVVFMDADLSTPIDELEVFLKELEGGSDVVIGTRKNKEASVKKRQPLYRELLGKGFTLLSNILLVRDISDFTCGFKGFSREVGQDIFRRQLIPNWSFDAEILFLARKLGYGIKEVPVTWFDAEGTKVRLWRDVIWSLFGIFQIRANYLLGTYKVSQQSEKLVKE